MMAMITTRYTCDNSGAHQDLVYVFFLPASHESMCDLYHRCGRSIPSFTSVVYLELIDGAHRYQACADWGCHRDGSRGVGVIGAHHEAPQPCHSCVVCPCPDRRRKGCKLLAPLYAEEGSVPLSVSPPDLDIVWVDDNPLGTNPGPPAGLPKPLLCLECRCLGWLRNPYLTRGHGVVVQHGAGVRVPDLASLEPVMGIMMVGREEYFVPSLEYCLECVLVIPVPGSLLRSCRSDLHLHALSGLGLLSIPPSHLVFPSSVAHYQLDQGWLADIRGQRKRCRCVVRTVIKWHDTNPTVTTLEAMFLWGVGYADHTLGSAPLASTVMVTGVAGEGEAIPRVPLLTATRSGIEDRMGAGRVPWLCL